MLFYTWYLVYAIPATRRPTACFYETTVLSRMFRKSVLYRVCRICKYIYVAARTRMETGRLFLRVCNFEKPATLLLCCFSHKIITRVSENTHKGQQQHNRLERRHYKYTTTQIVSIWTPCSLVYCFIRFSLFLLFHFEIPSSIQSTLGTNPRGTQIPLSRAGYW